MNFFTDLINNPIITIFKAGFYVKDIFAGWNMKSLGWVLGIAVEIFVILTILNFLSWVLATIKKIIKRFKT